VLLVAAVVRCQTHTVCRGCRTVVLFVGPGDGPGRRARCAAGASGDARVAHGARGLGKFLASGRDLCTIGPMFYPEARMCGRVGARVTEEVMLRGQACLGK
jgi:hypothetical protein